MSTCQQIIDRGFAKSAAARPETISSPAELVDRVGQCLREIFQTMARENPYIIGSTATVSFNGTGWPRPSDCLRAIGVRATSATEAVPTIAAGQTITVVPFDDQDFAATVPSVTELGQQYISTGKAIDPAGGNVLVIYARAPQVPTVGADSIDPLFPSMFDDILQYDIAAYMATKDKRAEDEQTFLAFKAALLQQMIDWSRGQTYELAQRFPIVTPPSTNTGGGRQQPAREAR